MTFTPAGAFAAGNRFLPLQGAVNVRDLGGYRAVGKKTVKWGTVYRAGDLNQLTPKDVAWLESLGTPRTVVDFRSQQEKAMAPHRLPKTVQKIVEPMIDPGDILSFKNFDGHSSDDVMVELNRVLVHSAQPQYRILVNTLANPDNLPLLFNCSAGKDRTGLGAVFFLAALGVDRETIVQDYLLSADAVKDRYAAEVAEKPETAPLYTVRREYLEAAFDEIDTRYHGMEAYLTRQLGVDLEQMRTLYTE
ncbi:tyrosine-protein phosphatase [Desulfosarcina sp. OttesenSCG-928-A07]|nr:tyrosine-protein phosphatase [Desulfosarcina sp. OttesenSCG-928-G17]MDL2328166.1 tyrosine-protein phosphatase [Desulfosarcina sp. OttesenSCG-928-A07]